MKMINNMRVVDTIIIHHTASTYGDVDQIRKWHIDRGFSDIGYHFLILNAYRYPNSLSLSDLATIEQGRPIEKIGAHAMGFNETSIGIALVGNFNDSLPHKAIITTTVELIVRLVKGEKHYGLVHIADELKKEPTEHIFTHGEIFAKHGKTTECAGKFLNPHEIRERVRLILS